MAGTYNKGEIKVRPGFYHRREAENRVMAASASDGVGAGIIRANWGPLNVPVEITSAAQAREVFGDEGTQDLITQMFQGGIVSGYFVRVGSGGTEPMTMLQNTQSSSAVQIHGRCVGDRPFSVSIRTSLTGDERECIIYSGLREFARYTFKEDTNISEAEALVNAINAGSDFTAELLVNTNASLVEVTQMPFANGSNPDAEVQDYSDALEALEPYAFNVLCVDTEMPEVHALVAAFCNRTYANGAFHMACIAGDKTLDLDARMDNARAFNDEKIHYCLNAAYDMDGSVCAGYRLAARVGGMIAAAQANKSLTHQAVSGFTALAEALTDSQIQRALQSGCIVLTTSSKKAVWIEQGINTLVSPGADQDEGWKKIRRTKTRFELMNRVQETLEELIGKVDNDSDGQSAILAAAQGVGNKMVSEDKLIDISVSLDPGNPPEGDSVWLVLDVLDKDSVEKGYVQYIFRYAE